MKKFMKAIAFATVMCMLLSTAAFAAETDGNAEWGTGATVNVVIDAGEANANKQIALVVSTANSAAEIATGNIKDVQQVALGNEGSLEITLGTGDATSANIFYGYEGRGAAGQLELAAQAVEPGDEISITIDAKYQPADFLAWATGDKATDNDHGAGAVVTLDLKLDEGRKVADMFWSIGYTETVNGETTKTDKAYLRANDAVINAFSGVLDGEVQLGVAFSAGSKNTNTIVTVDTVDVIVKTVKAADNSEAKELFTNAAEDNIADRKN